MDRDACEHGALGTMNRPAVVQGCGRWHVTIGSPADYPSWWARAQRLSSRRFVSCSFRSTAEACDSTVFTEIDSVLESSL